MGNVAAPAPAVFPSLGKIDVLDDCGRVFGKIELDSLDHAVATPKTLDDFTKLAVLSSSDFADGSYEFKQFFFRSFGCCSRDCGWRS